MSAEKEKQSGQRPDVRLGMAKFLTDLILSIPEEEKQQPEVKQLFDTLNQMSAAYNAVKERVDKEGEFLLEHGELRSLPLTERYQRGEALIASAIVAMCFDPDNPEQREQAIAYFKAAMEGTLIPLGLTITETKNLENPPSQLPPPQE